MLLLAYTAYFPVHVACICYQCFGVFVILNLLCVGVLGCFVTLDP
jgi:hypothetical protein